MSIAKKLLIAAVAMGSVSAAAPASAVIVTFNTNSTTLSCGTYNAANNGGKTCTAGLTPNVINIGGGALVSGGLTLSFDPTLVNSSVSLTSSAPTSNITLGGIDTTGATAGLYDLTGILLDIIVHSNPPNSDGSLPDGEISGTVQQNQANANIVFGTGSLQLGNFLYTVDPTFRIVPPNSSTAGVTTIQGTVSLVPEPATWGLMLLGFAGIGLAMRRRRPAGLAQLA